MLLQKSGKQGGGFIFFLNIIFNLYLYPGEMIQLDLHNIFQLGWNSTQPPFLGNHQATGYHGMLLIQGGSAWLLGCFVCPASSSGWFGGGGLEVANPLFLLKKSTGGENVGKYLFFRQQWLVLGVKLRVKFFQQLVWKKAVDICSCSRRRSHIPPLRMFAKSSFFRYVPALDGGGICDRSLEGMYFLFSQLISSLKRLQSKQEML